MAKAKRSDEYMDVWCEVDEVNDDEIHIIYGDDELDIYVPREEIEDYDEVMEGDAQVVRIKKKFCDENKIVNDEDDGYEDATDEDEDEDEDEDD